MTPDEVAAALDEYIDNNQDKKSELKNLALGLARKII